MTRAQAFSSRPKPSEARQQAGNEQAGTSRFRLSRPVQWARSCSSAAASCSGVQAVDHTPGNHQLRAKEAGQHQERLGPVEDPDGSGLVRKRKAAGRLPAAAKIAAGTDGGADSAKDRDGPDGRTENRRGEAQPSDLFSARLGLEPEETGDAEAEDNEGRSRRQERVGAPTEAARLWRQERARPAGMPRASVRETSAPRARWTRKNTARLMHSRRSA